MFTIRKLQYTVGLGYLIEDLLIVLQKHSFVIKTYFTVNLSVMFRKSLHLQELSGVLKVFFQPTKK